MITKLKKTGNSRAIIIPPAVLDLLKISDDSSLEVTTNGVSITISPVDENQVLFEASNNKVIKKHLKTFKALADR